MFTHTIKIYLGLRLYIISLYIDERIFLFTVTKIIELYWAKTCTILYNSTILNSLVSERHRPIDEEKEN